MLRLYCRARHRAAGGELCPDCAALHDYALQRLQRCPFGEDKPACGKCRVHCYKPDRREQVRQVMRWAGPRMTWRHPVLALRHLIDGRKPAPTLKKRE
ncbi:nitrous oxide-stimulated promoter family protein [Telmatospirillum siberiense]|uniref:Nitrous oxide-stimulated promoter family protein n=2 Tax=Telmatospirillum siberiense TaxID=382514 RepID=A0A2N3PYE5_9PROT|nr:nitrous oxide-stimulated promoter family protein [Telmatospirillum siberiense]